MRIALRSLLACLLGLTVAFQGYANVRTMDRFCPMTHAVGAHHAGTGDASSHHADAAPGHTHGHDPAPAVDELPPDDGSAMGQGHCYCAPGCQPVSGLAGPVLQPASVPAAVHVRAPADAFRSHATSSHWRPPAPLT